MATLAANALITLSEAKEALQITDSTSDDFLIHKINQASTLIESYTNRSFHSDSYTEIYDGGRRVVLKQYPVTDVSLVEYNAGTNGDKDWDTVAATEYALKAEDSSGDSTYGILLFDYTYSGEDRLRVTYTAGYAAASIPEDLKMAALDIVEYGFNTRKSGGIKSETLGEYSVTYQVFAGGDLMKALGLDMILNKYRTPTV